MANAVPTRVGQINGGGAADALFLKVFSGEVLAAFYNAVTVRDKHFVRTIDSGKSAQFPASWQGTASYHTPGNELNGSTISFAERIITIDSLLVADRFIANIDEAMNHYDVRSILSTDIGQALAQTWDKNVYQVLNLAARAATTVTGGNGGSQITSATSKTNADALVTAIFSAAQKLDEKNIPQSDRYVALKPAQYYLLVQGAKIVNKDYTTANGGVDTGKVFQVAGIPLVATNNLASTNVNTGVAAYQGDFSNTSATVWHKSAAGTVKLMDLSMEMEYQIQRQGTLMVGKYAMGHGILRPEAAVEIITA
jgi:major capsid protein